MKDRHVSFPGGRLSLEGVLSTPNASARLPAVVVCHPHPLYGGDMDNSVVLSVCEALQQASFIAFRFNFRGVGRSQGSYDNGAGEQDDVRAAISFLAGAANVDADRLALVGYSAGAAFGLPVAAGDARIRALVGISPPPTPGLESVTTCRTPKLFISGSDDDIVPATAVRDFCARCADPKDCAIVDGADHFWSTYESGLAKIVTGFLSRLLK